MCKTIVFCSLVETLITGPSEVLEYGTYFTALAQGAGGSPKDRHSVVENSPITTGVQEDLLYN